MKMKTSKHFRIMSVLLSCLMLLNTIAISAMAEDVAITTSITSHTDGEIIEGGKNVVLSAECNDETLSRIDFYANGNKLPGYITASGESLLWQTPAAGKYTLKAVATNALDAETASQEITVYVKSEDVISSFYSEADMKGWQSNTTSFSEWPEKLITDNAAFGTYSFALNNPPTWFIKYVKQFECADKKYINMPVYIEGIPEGKDGKIQVNMVVNSVGGNQTTQVFLKNGWQALTQEIKASAKGTNITQLAFGLTGAADTDAALTAEEKKAFTIYVNGLYFSDDNTVTAAPVIPDTQENVCYQMSKYRINFDKPLAMDLTADELAESVSITYGADGTVSGLSVVPGTDYIDVIIPEGSLDSNGTTYTVTVAADVVRTAYGTSYAGGTFTFSTIGSGCTTASPIPVITYPKADSLNAADSALAASVIFSGNVSKVEFVEIVNDVETVIGEATKATGEWVFTPATNWSAGSHTIKAKVTTTAAENNVFYSDAITFDVVTTDYRLVGIENGDVVVINEKLGRTVAVIDNDTNTHSVTLGKETHNGATANAATVTLNKPGTVATNVAKVVYSINGVKCGEVTSAPFQFELKTSKLDVNNLTVDIYDVIGNVKTISRTFNAVYGYEAQNWTEGFESENPAFEYTSLDVFPDATGTEARVKKFETFNGSNALYLYSGKGYAAEAPFTFGLMTQGLNLTNSVNKAFVEFDYNRSGYGGYNLNIIKIGESFDKTTGKQGAYATLILPQDCMGATNNSTYSNKVGLAVSWDNTAGTISAVLYIDGVECFRQSGPMNYRTSVDPTKLYVQFFGTPTGGKYWLDNLRVNAYSVPDDVTVFANGKQDREYDEAGNAEITVANVSATDAAALTNFVAVYDSSDRLVNIMPYAVPLAANTLSNATYPITLADGQYAKIFTLFDGTLMPITLK